MAIIRLDQGVVKKILEEVGTHDERVEILIETSASKAFIATTRTECLNEGRNEERAQLLTAMLQDRFGRQPGRAAAARRLSRWPDRRQAMHAISTAANLGDLPAQPPDGATIDSQ